MSPVLFFSCTLIGGTLGAEAGPDGIPPKAWDYCETQAEAGMTSEQPDMSLNSLFQVGRIMSGFARRWSCPMNRSHSHAFFSQGLNADCLDRLNPRVITKLSHSLIFQAIHSTLKFILALHSRAFYKDIVVMTWSESTVF